MKPSNWEYLPRKKKLQLGTELFTSPRGKYVISQALHQAITVMRRTPEHEQEESNIADMEVLRETVFDQFRPPSDEPLTETRPS